MMCVQRDANGSAEQVCQQQVWADCPQHCSRLTPPLAAAPAQHRGTRPAWHAASFCHWPQHLGTQQDTSCQAAKGLQRRHCCVQRHCCTQRPQTAPIAARCG